MSAKDLRDDVKTLLEYAQTLRAENESLKRALRGSFIFLRSDDKEEIYRAVTEAGIALPRLRTVGNINSSLLAAEQALQDSGISVKKHVGHAILRQDRGHLATGTPQARSLPNGSGFPPETAANVCVLGEGGHCCRARQEEESGGGVVGEECDPPVIHTASDLHDLLVDYNKLHGRLLKYTSNTISSSATTSPNIRDHHLKQISVAGLREHHNSLEFVIRVTWSNGQCFEVYRKYIDFFSFQATLKRLSSCEFTAMTSEGLVPKLPLSDHLLAVLGHHLNSKEALFERAELVDTFCKAVVAMAAESGREVVCRSSVLVFFSSRPGDIKIERDSIEQAEDSFIFLKDTPEDDIDDCLGFLSSLARDKETKWHNKHSDDPKSKEAVKRSVPLSSAVKNKLRFVQRSPAHAVLTHTHSAPSKPAAHNHHDQSLPTLVPNHAQVVARLSILKSPSSEPPLDPDSTAESPEASASAKRDNTFRHRSRNATANAQLARAKALCVKTGSTDWGVRDTRNGHSSNSENSGSQIHAT